MKKTVSSILAVVLCAALLAGLAGAVQARADGGYDPAAYSEYSKRAGLRSDYKIIYDKVYANINILKEDYEAGTILFDFSQDNITLKESNGDTIYIPIGSILADHPELEWIAPQALEAVVDAQSQKLLAIRLRSSYTNARIYPYQDMAAFESEMNQMEAMIDEIVSAANAYESDYEKLRYIHDWLLTNNVYNSYVAADESDLADVRAWSAVSAFLSNNDAEIGPVCEGYSEAFYILCERLGIPCVLMEGMEHQWNAVQLEGKWYAVDCTWDDPVGAELDFVRYNYFLVGTETVTMSGFITYGQDHIPYSTSNIPQINGKGLVLVSGLEAEDTVYDGQEHGASGTLSAVQGNTEIEGSFEYSYYSLAADGSWEELSEGLPTEAGTYKVRAEFIHAEYEGYQEQTYVIEAAEIPEDPTEAPSEEPTEAPTEAPSEAPTEVPTEAPSEAPTEVPTEAPSEEPTEGPTEAPSEPSTEAPKEDETPTNKQDTTAEDAGDNEQDDKTAADISSETDYQSEPKVGDEGDMALWQAILGVSLLLGSAAVVKKTRIHR